MLRRALVTAAASAVVAVSATAASTAPAPLLGVVDGQLTRLDSQTLRPLPGKRLDVGSGGCASRSGGSACWTVPPWAFSPGRSVVAIARNDALMPSLRLVDVARLRVLAHVPVGEDPIGAIAWPTRARMLVLEDTGTERQRLVVVDVPKRRIVLRRALGGSIVRLERMPRSVVMLVAPPNAVGAAKIVVADASGSVRSVPLGRIGAGTKLLRGPTHSVESRLPGLAVDASRRRAFVVSRRLIAEIDLATLDVSYHAFERTLSMRAKTSSGYTRSARWLGGDVLAVSGADYADSRTQPAGLQLVDARDWSARTIDRSATRFVVTLDLLLTTGPGDETTGVAAYTFDGAKRFEVLAGKQAWVVLVHRDLAYIGGERGPLRVLDLTTGRIVSERAEPLPWLLLVPASGWWGPS